MKKNVGTIDRAIRLIVGIAIVVYGIVEGSWLGVIGIIPIATALISWCPLYPLLKISTCNKES
jgi:hypothetical protein